MVYAVPLWRADFSIPGAGIMFNVNSYVPWFATGWMILFAVDVVRVTRQTRPIKEPVKSFAAIERGVPHRRYTLLPEGGFVVLLRNCIPSQTWQEFGASLESSLTAGELEHFRNFCRQPVADARGSVWAF